jgi:hypothetical protein
MVRSLQDAIERISQLPPGEQEEFAAFIAAELASEKRWADLIARSPDKLASLANEALAENRLEYN